MIDFLGIGAQKSGTSWIYACLYEHPEICIPVKEIHFFSRPRFEKGKAWYEAHFKKCKQGTKKGEFSTSYLYADEAPARIHDQYPDVKLIAVLRNPLTRAFSQYKNAIKAGEIQEDVSFDTYVQNEPSCLGQGKYMEQIHRYLKLFAREQLLVLLYEDMVEDPLAFIHSIYVHLDVDASFVPPSLHTRINVARTPRNIGIEKVMHKIAEGLRKSGLDAFVHMIRKTGIPDLVRAGNTKQSVSGDVQPDLARYREFFREDIERLVEITGPDMIKKWNI